MVGRTLSQPGPVRLALYADAAFELFVAIVLAASASTWADLFNVDQAVIWGVAGVFLLAALAVGFIAAMQIESRELVYGLAAANIVGGLALWAAWLFLRDDLDPGARWAAAAVADTFILVGLLEIFVLRRTPPRIED
ncbi:MAG: hypothetical protein ACRDHY_03675 [Anaerolineales bacterium]